MGQSPEDEGLALDHPSFTLLSSNMASSTPLRAPGMHGSRCSQEKLCPGGHRPKFTNTLGRCPERALRGRGRGGWRESQALC